MSAIEVAPMDALVRRAELVEKAEELAAIATEQAALAHDATAEDLLSLPVAALALEQTAHVSAAAYARWAQLAEADDDRLLARSLEGVARTLRELAERAHTASVEGYAYAESVREDAEQATAADSDSD